jgi:hypothetical protein
MEFCFGTRVSPVFLILKITGGMPVPRKRDVGRALPAEHRVDCAKAIGGQCPPYISSTCGPKHQKPSQG